MQEFGLPSSLECALRALLQENSISSWRITGERGSTLVLLRLTGSDTDAMQSTRPQHYRRKPPSTLKRDARQAEERQAARNLQQASEHLNKQTIDCNESPALFTSPLNEEHNTPVTIHTVTHNTVLESPRSAVTVAKAQLSDSVTVESRSDASDTHLDYNTSSAVAPNEEFQDVFSETTMVVEPSSQYLSEEEEEDDDDEEEVKAAAIKENINPEQIKDQVSKVMDKGVQDRLRQLDRNTRFKMIVVDKNDRGRLLFESGDVVLACRIPRDGTDPNHRVLVFQAERRSSAA